MSWISLVAAVAVSSQIFAWMGLYDQFKLTALRATTEGLSLFEAEARLWGKLPWILFAFSLPEVDLGVLVSNVVGISLATLLLTQFSFYRVIGDSQTNKRVAFQLLLLGSTVALALLSRFFLQQTAIIWSFAPVVASMISIPLGTYSQYQKNRLLQSTSALSLRRYKTLVSSYVLWFLYGFIKGTSTGWDGAWAICVSTGIGIIASSAVLAQFYSYRAPQRISVLAHQ